MATRKALGNAKRFRIFERDGFRCQYCGRTPPLVILQVDHIHPVSKGGTNDEANLVTSCMPCNAGKRDRIIEPEAVPRDYASMAEDAKQKAIQLREYRKHYTALRKEIDAAIDEVGMSFFGDDLTWSRSEGMAERNRVEHIINTIGLDQAIDSARITFAKFRGGRYNDSFRYFCGVSWRKADSMGIRPPDKT